MEIKNSLIIKSIEKNWPIWLALNHFLSNRYLHILLNISVKSTTDNKYQFSDLFEDLISKENFPSLGFVRPKIEFQKDENVTAIQSYIQKIFFIGDNYTYFPNSFKSKISSKVDFFRELLIIGSSHFASLKKNSENLINIEMIRDFPNVEIFCKVLESLSIISNDSSEPLEIWNKILDKLKVINDNLISFLILKHCADLYLSQDRCDYGINGYKAALEVLESIDSGNSQSDEFKAWNDITNLCINSCLKNLIESKESRYKYNNNFYESKLKQNPVLIANGSGEFYNEFFHSNDNRFIPQYNIVEENLFSNSHHLSIYSWLKKDDYTHTKIWSIIRRQIAIGAIDQAKNYKSLYAQAFFELFRTKNNVLHNPNKYFIWCLELLIESERSDHVLQVKWSDLDKQINQYVTIDIIDNLINHSTKYSGVYLNRLKVVVEMFKEWFPLLSKNNSDVIIKIWEETIKIAKENLVTFYSDVNAAGNAFEALKEYAKTIPNLKYKVSNEISELVKISIENNKFWRGIELPLEMSLYYLDSFDPLSLKKIILTVLELLKLHIANNFISQAALEILVSKQVINFLDKKENLEIQKDVFEQIISYGNNEEGNTIVISNYLRDFSKEKIKELSLKERMQPSIQKLIKEAEEFTSSRAVHSLNSLLNMYKIIDLRIFKRLTNNIILVMEKVIQDKRSPFSFWGLYDSILILIDIYEKNKENESYYFLFDVLKSIQKLLNEIWIISIEYPGIFSRDIIPRTNTSDPVIVYNWAFTTIKLSKIFKNSSEIQNFLIGNAKKNSDMLSPVLKIIIDRNLLQVTDNDEIATNILKYLKETIKTKNEFYEILSSITSNFHKLKRTLKNKYMNYLIEETFKYGPNILDLTVFTLLLQYKDLKIIMDKADLERYYDILINSNYIDKEIKSILTPTVDSLYISRFEDN